MTFRSASPLGHLVIIAHFPALFAVSIVCYSDIALFYDRLIHILTTPRIMMYTKHNSFNRFLSWVRSRHVYNEIVRPYCR